MVPWSLPQLERRADDSFVVGTKERDYILQASSPKELEEWMQVLTPAQQCAELLHKATVAKNAGRVRLARVLRRACAPVPRVDVPRLRPAVPPRCRRPPS